MRKGLYIGIIILSIVLSQGIASASVVDLITNGDFSAGMTDWIAWSWMVDAAGNTLNWDNRPEAPHATGNAMGATQVLNADVSGYTALIFKLDVMPVYQSTDSPGSYELGDYPARVEIDYTDINGDSRDFQHGFYYTGYGANAVPGTYVPQNTWYSYTSPDLLTLAYMPKTIEQVHIYGNGIDYAGKADNVQLLGTPVPEPASMILFGLGTLGFGIIKRKRR